MSFRRKARTFFALAQRRRIDRRRWREIASVSPTSRGHISVFYGTDRLPGEEEFLSGGMVKFQRLATAFPNAPREFNLLYLGSSSAPPDAGQLVRLARRRAAGIVWNQDGVAYPGWSGRRTRGINRSMARVLHEADYVFYQSIFCRTSADRFLGKRQGPSEVLYNAIDTQTFTPAERKPNGFVLLLGGNQYARYRLETALRAFALVARERPDARLIVTGELAFTAEPAESVRIARQLIEELEIGDRVELSGRYPQADAPGLLQRAHILLHTKVNDPCPSVVIEAMACGLPVVYAASGGVPELVAEEAGIGVPAPLRWDRDAPPPPAGFAAAVLTAMERLEELSAAARARAVHNFDLRPWLERHREVFEALLRR